MCGSASANFDWRSSTRPSAQFEHTLLVTADGAEILTLP
jgi:methionine aminopeptidase